MKLMYFSWIRERLDIADEVVDLPHEISTLGELVEWMKTRGEVFEAVFNQENIVRIAVDKQHVVDLKTNISSANEIAFFPPMTGG